MDNDHTEAPPATLKHLLQTSSPGVQVQDCETRFYLDPAVFGKTDLCLLHFFKKRKLRELTSKIASARETNAQFLVLQTSVRPLVYAKHISTGVWPQAGPSGRGRHKHVFAFIRT